MVIDNIDITYKIIKIISKGNIFSTAEFQSEVSSNSSITAIIFWLKKAGATAVIDENNMQNMVTGTKTSKEIFLTLCWFIILHHCHLLLLAAHIPRDKYHYLQEAAYACLNPQFCLHPLQE